MLSEHRRQPPAHPGTPLGSSPALERFDHLLSRLRKSTLHTSIHAPKPEPSTQSRPANNKQHSVTHPATGDALSETTKTSTKSPLATPQGSPLMVRLCTSTTTSTPTPISSACATTAPRSANDLPAPESSPHSKLDWATLVEAARQSDAGDDELPDLTEWATAKDPKQLPAHRQQQQQPPENTRGFRSRERPTPDGGPQLSVQSRPEISASMARRLVKIQLGGLARPVPTTHETNTASRDSSSGASSAGLSGLSPSSSSRFPAHNNTTTTTHLPPSTSSRLLNSKQKLSIARLIIPVLPDNSAAPPGSVFSASTATASTATTSTSTATVSTAAGSTATTTATLSKPPAPSSTVPVSALPADTRPRAASPPAGSSRSSSYCAAAAAVAHPIHTPRVDLTSSSSSSSSCAAGPSGARTQRASARASSARNRNRNGPRHLDPSGLRAVSDCLHAADDDVRPSAKPALPVDLIPRAEPAATLCPLVSSPAPAEPSCSTAPSATTTSTTTTTTTAKKPRKKKKKGPAGADKKTRNQLAQEDGRPPCKPAVQPPGSQNSPAVPAARVGPPAPAVILPPSASASKPADPRRARGPVNLFDKLTGGALLNHHA